MEDRNTEVLREWDGVAVRLAAGDSEDAETRLRPSVFRAFQFAGWDWTVNPPSANGSQLWSYRLVATLLCFFCQLRNWKNSLVKSFESMLYAFNTLNESTIVGLWNPKVEEEGEECED